MEDYTKLRDLFRESADILDEIIELDNKELSELEKVNENEALLGRFMIKMLVLQQFTSSM